MLKSMKQISCKWIEYSGAKDIVGAVVEDARKSGGLACRQCDVQISINPQGDEDNPLLIKGARCGHPKGQTFDRVFGFEPNAKK